MQTKKIAASFVGLALSHDWNRIPELSDEEIRILFSIVSIAGFKPAEIVRGKLVCYLRDVDGSKTGESFIVNNRCPYKVIGQDGNDCYRATGWLNGVLELVAGPSSSLWVRGKVLDSEKLAADIEREIERSIPLEPIRLTSNGDYLREPPPPFDECLVDHSRDDDKISAEAVGIHNLCGGWMDRWQSTETSDVLVCRRCYLRVLFPKEAKTYGKLRELVSFALSGFPA
ncbi:MAG: hypothetical protein G01um101449_64 [Parcubacteria group bacterium Gr01-1014_49]|nr:MAG: hypothetical protein G01um101449_64 [Parcubacteria group bacterium Gr01-1014_49]